MADPLRPMRCPTRGKALALLAVPVLAALLVLGALAAGLLVQERALRACAERHPLRGPAFDACVDRPGAAFDGLLVAAALGMGVAATLGIAGLAAGVALLGAAGERRRAVQRAGERLARLEEHYARGALSLATFRAARAPLLARLDAEPDPWAWRHVARLGAALTLLGLPLVTALAVGGGLALEAIAFPGALGVGLALLLAWAGLAVGTWVLGGARSAGVRDAAAQEEATWEKALEEARTRSLETPARP